ncbi:helix-turn-helix domain-containing protein [Agarilytica rhodophyticola]|uniref:helix-turn-helix domain-containing protein n=1 Tax=Agarilytica rhodophyticola TaxID=1737490 RepID=UPI00131A2917|nr:helix-turn-helix domain-containing protein [Agarilytica rhodophyticola]
MKVSEKKQYVFKETTTNQLLMIVGGYLFIWFVGFSAHTAYHLTENMNIASSIGKTAIYLNFIMLIALFTFFWRARLDSNMYEHSHIEDEPQFRQDMDFNVRKISQLIENKKPYLQPNMTLDRMAHELNTTPRALSVVLNEFYGISFYQYLNQNRIEEAKKLLASQGKRTQISSIYSLAGFTSRTTFNVKFKEFVGQTPSEYRRAVINNIR